MSDRREGFMGREKRRKRMRGIWHCAENTGEQWGLTGYFSGKHVQRSGFSVQRSAISVLRSAISDQRLAFSDQSRHTRNSLCALPNSADFGQNWGTRRPVGKTVKSIDGH